MNTNFKKCGGDKPQPYIPAGNGKKSGEYTSKNKKFINKTKCVIFNVPFKYNYQNSQLVKIVNNTYIAGKKASLRQTFKKNSVIKKVSDGHLIIERYYDKNGEAYLDIDYTCHGNPNQHPIVPHIHRWEKNEDGLLVRKNGRIFNETRMY